MRDESVGHKSVGPLVQEILGISILEEKRLEVKSLVWAPPTTSSVNALDLL